MIDKYILNFFPNAKTGDEVTEQFLKKIEKVYNTDLKKLLFATSVCCDDVNISTDFRRFLNRPFSLGGLSGYPFTGLTGMLAFSNHIPEGGDAFIFYGPHIGITDDGILGEIQRFGQSYRTNDCGALMLALNRMKKSSIPQTLDSKWDHQQILLEQDVSEFRDVILNSKLPQKEITEVAYNGIHGKIKSLVDMTKDKFLCKRIFLLGGIIINTSPKYHDYVDIRNFEIVELEK